MLHGTYVFLLFTDMFQTLNAEQIEHLIRLLIKRQLPFGLLANLNFYDKQKMIKFSTVCLENLPPNIDLKNLLMRGKDFHLSLSNDQLKLLLNLWKTTSNKTELFRRLRELYYNFHQDNRDFESLVALCVDLDIDFDQFILEAKDSIYALKLSCSYIVNVLKSSELNQIKLARIAPAFSILNSLDGGDYDPLGVYLAKKCPTDDLGLMITWLPRVTIIPYNIARGFFSTLLTDAQTTPDRIQSVFVGFWTCWQKYNSYNPSIAKLLLPYIDSEAKLEAIYRAIPQGAADRQEIIDLLKHEQSSNDGTGRTLKVPLPQDVIDRIVV